MHTLVKKATIGTVIALGLLVALAPTAFACGGLIAPDGDVRLDKAATLIAWHDGIEHYLTSFAYTDPNQTGSANADNTTTNVGWIVPLPAVPLKIEDGGAWTLQRLERETLPPEPAGVVFDTAGAAPSAAQVLQQVQVEALDVTIVRGSGPAIVDWAKTNGFFINDETAAHLGIYAKGSPIFMAAKYNAAIAQQRGQISGDGVPLLITMKTAHPWVPLEVLALDGQQVNADLYFLTDEPLNVSDFNAVVGESAVGQTVPNAPGMTVAFQEKVTPQLYHDLSTDRNMGWVWPDSWFTYVSLNAPDTSVTYDLGISPRGVIRLAPFGTAPMAVVDGAEQSAPPSWMPSLPLGTPEYALGGLLLLIVVGLIVWMARGHGKRVSAWERDHAGPKPQKSL
jgi:hypothetical protein